MNINRTRLIVGSLLAGIFLTFAGAFLAHGILGSEYSANFRSHMSVPPDSTTIAQNVAVRMLLGFVAAFLYVGFRPRFGPGPKTALIGAALLWLSAYLPMIIGFLQFEILVGWQLWVALLWGISESAIACLLAGWVYREAN